MVKDGKKQLLAKIFFPIIALFFMLLGSQITNIFSFISGPNNRIDCQLLVLVFLTAYFYFGYSAYLVTVAVVIGAIYDIYFSELLGIYTICLPIMILIFHVLQKYVKPSILGYLMLFVFCHIFLIYSSYIIPIIFNVTKPDFIPYIVLYVAPTLVLNIIIDLGALFYGEKYYLNVTK